MISYYLFFTLFLLSFNVVTSEPEKGKVTYYDANGLGTCSFIQHTSSPLMITAFSGSEWNGAAYCGRCVKITNSDGKSVVVRIVDKCPGCAKGHFDLSRDAFKALDDLSKGVLQITYEFVACPTEGNIIYRVKDGSTTWWSSVVVNNHKYGVKKFEIKGKGMDWTEVKRADYNEFEYTTKLEVPVSFRVTSIYGEVITDENIIKDENHFAGIYKSSGQFSSSASYFSLSSSVLFMMIISFLLFI